MTNVIQNVRVVDKDEGSDDVRVSRLIQAYNTSEGQIRVVCGVRQEVTPAGATTALIGFGELQSSDDFVSFSAQYLEFRVRAIRFDVYDIQPSSAPTINYWSTYHTIGTLPTPTVEDIMDRPDCRAIPPGTGKASLAWVAHGLPENDFLPTSTSTNLGGLAWYTSPSAAVVGTKYQVTAKYVVDFRGRR
jgi:hypothetical protein